MADAAESRSGLENLSSSSRGDLEALVTRLVEEGDVPADIVNRKLDEIQAETRGGARTEGANDGEVTRGTSSVQGRLLRLLRPNEKYRLSPEVRERTLSALEARFLQNNHLHEGCDWNRVRRALEKKSKALWSVAQMEALGHDPNVFYSDKRGFFIGTCSKETPPSTRNCAVSKEAEDETLERDPEFKGGNAIESAQAMGLKVMALNQYKHLQGRDKFDLRNECWVLTAVGDELAYNARRPGRNFLWQLLNNSMNSHSRGWRGCLAVKWTLF